MLKKLGVVLFFSTFYLACSTSAIEVDFPDKVIDLGLRQFGVSVYVRNDESELKAIELIAKHRSHTLDSVERLTPVTGNQVVVIPNQLLLRPGERKRVKIIWASSNVPKQEIPFRLITRELPIPIPGLHSLNRPKVKFLSKFVSAFYVTPRDTRSEVEVQSFQVVDTAQKRSLQMVIENSGTRHQVVRELAVEFKKSVKISDNLESKKMVFHPKDFGKINILAGERRRITVPLPLEIQSVNEIQSITNG